LRFFKREVDKKVDILPRAPAPNAERGFLKSGYSDDSVKYVQETRSLGLFKHLLLSSEKIHYLYFGSND